MQLGYTEDDRQCENGNKQRTYRLHKDRLEDGDYLNENIPRYKKKVLSRLICRTLAIAVGRYSKPKKPLEERLCTLCHLNAIKSFIRTCIKNTYIPIGKKRRENKSFF